MGGEWGTARKPNPTPESFSFVASAEFGEQRSTFGIGVDPAFIRSEPDRALQQIFTLIVEHLTGDGLIEEGEYHISVDKI